MEFARRIGDLAHLTRRLSRAQVDQARAQRAAAAARFLPTESASKIRGGEARGKAERVYDSDGGGLIVSRQRRRRAAAAASSHNTQAWAARTRDQLLLRRLPVAVSVVERSWFKLDRKQRERMEKRRHLRSPAACPSAQHGEGASSDSGARALVGASDKAIALDKSFVPLSTAARPSLSATTAPASHQQLEAVSLLLQLLHTMEQARRHRLAEKEAAVQRRCAVADTTWQSFQKEFGAQLLRGSHRSLAQERHEIKRTKDKKTTDTSSLSPADEKLLHETAELLQQRRRTAREDLGLLHASLLTRPFISARLWRLLLGDSVWTAAVAEHKRAAAMAAHSPAALAPTTPPLEVTRLLSLSLALTRLSMGVLRDYVQGGQLSRHAPRFVVSLPSRSFRIRTAANTHDHYEEREKAADEQKQMEQGASLKADDNHLPEEHGESDALFAMLQDAEDAALAPSVLHSTAATRTTPAAPQAPQRPRRRHTAISMRWIPPHTAEVLPLVIDTLALHRFVLAELDLPVLLQRGCAPELISLCVTLQHLASTTLALTNDAAGETKTDLPSLHRTLHGLEEALTGVGTGVVAHLIKDCEAAARDTHGSGDVSNNSNSNARRTPEDAARLAVQLHSLRLLRSHDAGVALLLSRLLTEIFPELRTQTSRVLHEKARQSSLLAFATRGHRQKLYQQHGRQHAETFLLETVVQQARLQQRQLAVALREQHVTEVHVRCLRELGQKLPRGDLLQLFQLYARHAAAGSDNNTSAENGGPGHLAAPAGADVYMTGCLFLAETILLAAHAEPHSTAGGHAYTVAELAMLWDAAALLFPHIRARRARQLTEQRGTAAPGRPRAVAAAHTESLIWATFAEHVLSSVNAALAARLQHLEEQRMSESTAMRRRAMTKSTERAVAEELSSDGVSMNTVVALAAGVLEYAGSDETLRGSGGVNGDGGQSRQMHTSTSLLPVQQAVRVLSRLLHELVLHDRLLWRQVRRLPAAQRDAVEGQLRECFHTLGMLDETTMRALEMLNREGSVLA